MELLAEPHLVRPALVEGEVHDRRLWADGGQRGASAAGLPAALEGDVGAVVAGPVPPPSLERRSARRRRAAAAVSPSASATASRSAVASTTTTSAAPWWRASRPVSSPTTPAPTTSTRRPATPSASDRTGPPTASAAACSSAVRADRAHVRDVHAEHRVEVVRQRDHVLGGRVGDVAGGVPVRAATRVPTGSAARPALHHGAGLHVADPGHRVRAGRLAGGEHAELGVEVPAQERVRALVPGQLGAGGQPGVRGGDPDPAVRQLAVRLLDQLGLAGPGQDQPVGQPAPAATGSPVAADAGHARSPSRWVAPAPAAYGARVDARSPGDRVEELAVDRLVPVHRRGEHLRLGAGPLDHQLLLGHVQPQPAGGDGRQRGAVLGRQQRAGGERADRAGREADRDRGDVVDVAGGAVVPGAGRGTSSTSPTSSRARSSTWVSCSTTWPPDRARVGHQAGGGTLSSQAPSDEPGRRGGQQRGGPLTVSRQRQW